MIKVVSLGAGDPEMITLKGLRALQSAERIFCPMTVKGGVELSRSADVVCELGIEESKIERYQLPMSHDRGATLEVYRGVAQLVVELSRAGKDVVITAEGDGGFFSSSQYIHEMIEGEGCRVERVAGVPAFIDCASLAGIHIASGRRGIEVVPSVATSRELMERVERDRANIVLMKLSQSEGVIKEAIEQMSGDIALHYFENRGGADEFYSADRETILGRKFPYFSILIIGKF